jgi:hypothetical protein
MSAGTLDGLLQRVRGVGELPLQSVSHRRGFAELRRELGFALRESLDVRGMCLKSLLGVIECRLQLA